MTNKIVDKWNDGHTVNFKMENGDLTTLEWFSFKGSDTTMVNVLQTKTLNDDFLTDTYKLILYKELASAPKLEMLFEGKDGDEIVESEITMKQLIKPNKDYYTNKIIKAFYEKIAN